MPDGASTDDSLASSLAVASVGTCVSASAVCTPVGRKYPLNWDALDAIEPHELKTKSRTGAKTDLPSALASVSASTSDSEAFLEPYVLYAQAEPPMAPAARTPAAEYCAMGLRARFWAEASTLEAKSLGRCILMLDMLGMLGMLGILGMLGSLSSWAMVVEAMEEPAERIVSRAGWTYCILKVSVFLISRVKRLTSFG